MKKLVGGLAALLVASLLAAIQADASSLVETARALAENVLGAGTVRSLAIADHGGTILMRWESATYRPEHQRERTRDLIYAEAELATGSIMGRLNDVARIRFSIMLKDQILATGENARGKGVLMQFSLALGGGTYSAPVLKDKKTSGGSGEPAKKD